MRSERSLNRMSSAKKMLRRSAENEYLTTRYSYCEQNHMSDIIVQNERLEERRILGASSPSEEWV
jgi:hypothetical protein